ncbi:chemotaxis signal transduction protein [Hypnocyclicus thermotrophus]|uniref:Chemotaxis signal transduction protein n=1 Tax=Hypnocyclicus thermotrophus TaxID=1627895 RepID=A0AA46E0D1_9FUSO|nr:chemotaxis protein CheW [Hypnocyclicus thermotrophus]TDT72514.1 chemotaxis signal transduction protein [Hypnocyclicus thermotrophus]
MKYFSFVINKKKYIIENKYIKEVIEENNISPIYSKNKNILGIINYRNDIIPVLSIEKNINSNKMLILNYNNSLYALKIEKILEFLDIEEFSNEIIKIKNIEYIYFNLNKLLEIKKILVSDTNDTQINNIVKKQIKKTEKFLIFKINNEKYGLNANEIVEIINYKKIKNIPFKNKDINILEYKGKSIVVIDILEKINNEKIKLTDFSKIIILEKENKKLGILVSNIVELIGRDNNEILEIPHYLISKNIKEISSITYDNEKNMIFILDIFILMNYYEKVDIRINNKNNKDTIKKTRFIEFEIKNKKYAVKLNEIEEILSFEKNDNLNVYNLRGEVLPLYDLNKKFNNKNKENNLNNKIIVKKINNNKIGFIVEKVLGIKEIEENNILNITNILLLKIKYFKGVYIEKNIKTIIVDLKEIISQEEMKLIKEAGE